MNYKKSEFDFMVNSLKEMYFTTAVGFSQLLSLWTAFCLHHDLEVDTSEYDKLIGELWRIIESGGYSKTVVWKNREGFEMYMCRCLV